MFVLKSPRLGMISRETGAVSSALVMGGGPQRISAAVVVSQNLTRSCP
jgi:hypothetical protein